MPVTLLSVARWIVIVAYVRLLFGATRTFKKSGGGIGSWPLAITIWVLLAQCQRTPLFLPLAIPAIILVVASLALFQWAANSIRDKFFSYIGDSDTPQFVFQGGPYAYVRNPFYLSYLLTNAAVAMAFPTWISGAAALSSLIILWIASIYEERKFANSLSAEEYRAYMTRAGDGVPTLVEG